MESTNMVGKDGVSLVANGRQAKRVQIGALLVHREVQLLVVVLVMATVLGLVTSSFFTYQNFLAIVGNDSMKGVVMIGITLLLITGNFDLSVASNMALTGVVTAWLLVSKAGILLSIAGGLATGTAIGVLNGLLVTKARLPSFIATLGTMYMARSLAFVMTEGLPVANLPQRYVDIGDVYWLGLPNTFIFMIIAVTTTSLLLKRQRFLRKLFYIGANRTAAIMVGLEADSATFAMFVLSGFLCAVASILMTAKMTAGLATAFNNQEMRLIAAGIIGGASLSGGKGSIMGSLLGFTILVLVGNAMTLLGLSSYLEGIIFGAILIASLIGDAYINGNVRSRT